MASLSTDLSISPYYDDFDQSKNFSKILFQPGVSVQARELNQLQTLLQSQIERFGDNIFATGTIVSGCNFVFYNPYHYIKLEDLTTDSAPVRLSVYVNNHIVNETTGLKAMIMDKYDGFEASDPDLSTLYLDYITSGFDSNTFYFTPGDTLRIYNGRQNGIETIEVESTGIGFSNLDTLISVSSISVNVSSGSFVVGDFINNGGDANLEILSIDSNTLSSVNQLILRLKPRNTDLANASVTTSRWSLSNNESVANFGNTAAATVTGIIGVGYRGKIVTDGVGRVSEVLLLSKGFGYTSLPYITIRSVNNTTGYSTLDLNPHNYIDQVKVATVANAVGDGYGFSINDGVIYQKGYFIRVPSQAIIVSKYDVNPSNVAVGFVTTEVLIDSNIDTTLNDPAAGDNNGAPGANRLKLTPQLVLTNTSVAQSNSQILPIIEWSQGQPYIQQQQTVYSKIGDTMAQRTFESAGNYFLDPFLITTASPIANDTTNKTFDLIVDPGLAYIEGYRIETKKNFYLTHPKDFEVVVQNNHVINLNYDNYIQINEVGGTFGFNLGDTVDLYDTNKRFISNTALVAAQNTAPTGQRLGTARIRSMVLDSGQPGTNTATYNLYLFNINMNQGRNFGNVKSVYYNGTRKGIADVIQTLNPTTSANTTSLNANAAKTMIFNTQPVGLMQAANNLTYIYRTVDTTLTTSNSGIIVKNISATPNEFFPYTGTLTSAQLSELYVVPPLVDLVYSANLTGTVAGNATTSNVTGTSTQFISQLQVGDYLYVYKNAGFDLRYVKQIVNNTLIILNANLSVTNSSANVARSFPASVPIPLGSRSGLTANVDTNQNILTINLGANLTTATSESITLAVNVERRNVTQETKTPTRNRFVKLCLANNAGSTAGPWCLGVPDIFRMKGVWIGNSSVIETGTNYFSSFYLDHNQNIDFLDLGWLFLSQQANISLSSSNYLLVEFDHFTSTGAGAYDITSYISANAEQTILNDLVPLANLTSSINTLEIPEFIDDIGYPIDLMQMFDFRPCANATVTPTTTSNAAPINPSSNVTFSATEKKFPLPGTALTSDISSYITRVDSAFVDKRGRITSIPGTVNTRGSSGPKTPPSSLRIADIIIPGYPCIPQYPSVQLRDIMATGIANKRFSFARNSRQSIRITSIFSQNNSKKYGMSDVATIDRRLQQVEYYLNLNQLEANVASMTIPSTSDPSINRFKFGFFVDDFSTYKFVDFQDPGYRAAVENQEVIPSKLQWEVYFGTDFDGFPTYIPQAIVSQENATIGTLDDPNSVPVCAMNVANVIAYTYRFRNITDSSGLYAPNSNTVDVVNIALADAEHMSNFDSGVVEHPFARTQIEQNDTSGFLFNNANTGIDPIFNGFRQFFNMQGLQDFWSSAPQSSSATTGTVELFFYAYDSSVKFQIYQGSTEVASSTSAQNLTDEDKRRLTSASTNYWFDDQKTLFLKPFVSNGNGFVSYSGKVVWDYNGSGGNNITIRTTNGVPIRNWRWVLSYPINGESAGCTPPPPPFTCPPGYEMVNGTDCILPPPPPVPPEVAPPPPDIVYDNPEQPQTYSPGYLPPPPPPATIINVSGCTNAGVNGLEQQYVSASAAAGAQGADNQTVNVTMQNHDGTYTSGNYRASDLTNTDLSTNEISKQQARQQVQHLGSAYLNDPANQTVVNGKTYTGVVSGQPGNQTIFTDNQGRLYSSVNGSGKMTYIGTVYQ